VSLRYVALAGWMWLVTYPARAVPLMTPGVERLPRWALAYLRLVGPAVLAALAATASLVVSDGSDHHLEVGVTAASVALGTAVVVWRRNLLLGLAVAVASAALARALGWG
jgi:branched-subunit amino acid transport protein